MERMMGRADNPLRRILNHASREFLGHLPIVYILTVIGREPSGELVIRGLFAGDDEACFERAAALSLRVNFELLPRHWAGGGLHGPGGVPDHLAGQQGHLPDAHGAGGRRAAGGAGARRPPVRGGRGERPDHPTGDNSYTSTTAAPAAMLVIVGAKQSKPFF
ncbi:unnamed protein product [Heterosigma akashiwo]